MGRPSKKPAEDKVRIVVSVLRGELAITEAARRESVSATAIAGWRDAFLAGGAQALADGARHGPTGREHALAAEIEQLTAALGEAHMELRLWRKGGSLPAWDELEAERVSMQLTVELFCQVTGVPRATWYRWRSVGSSVKGPWPTPAQDAIEAAAKDMAGRWDAWGHRKLAELVREERKVSVSDSTMFRILNRNALALPVGHTGEVRQLAAARKQAFIEAPTRRNRLWQADFSEFETSTVGTWNLGGVVDYVTRVNLACTITVTKTTDDAIGMFEAALGEVEVLLGVSWVHELTDPATGEIGTLVLVTDNVPRFKSARFAGWVKAQRHVRHVRTRVRSPQTNGRIERFFRSIKYEHLYRREISDGDELHRQCTDYRTIYNSIRPHEHLGMATPLKTYRQPPTQNFPAGESVSEA